MKTSVPNIVNHEYLRGIYYLIGIITFLFFLSGGLYGLVAHVRNNNAHFIENEKAGLLKPDEKVGVINHLVEDDVFVSKDKEVEGIVRTKELEFRLLSLEKEVNALKVEIYSVKELLLKIDRNRGG